MTKILSVHDEHNHDMISENIVSIRQILNSQIRIKCENNLFTRPNNSIKTSSRSFGYWIMEEKYIRFPVKKFSNNF